MLRHVVLTMRQNYRCLELGSLTGLSASTKVEISYIFMYDKKQNLKFL